MGKGKNSSTAAKKTTEKRALDVPEMDTVTQIWPVSSTKSKHLQKLLSRGIY